MRIKYYNIIIVFTVVLNRGSKLSLELASSLLSKKIVFVEECKHSEIQMGKVHPPPVLEYESIDQANHTNDCVLKGNAKFPFLLGKKKYKMEKSPFTDGLFFFFFTFFFFNCLLISEVSLFFFREENFLFNQLFSILLRMRIMI